jgi:hypothetical protein
VAAAADLALAVFREGAIDWHSTTQMQLKGGIGLLVLAAALMRLVSSTNPASVVVGRRLRHRRHGVMKLRARLGGLQIGHSGSCL